MVGWLLWPSAYDLAVTTIDPEKHADLIRLRREATTAHERLLAYDPAPGERESEEQRGERARLREAAGDASMRVRAAMYDIGLVAEHGYHRVDVDLRNAARE